MSDDEDFYSLCNSVENAGSLLTKRLSGGEEARSSDPQDAASLIASFLAETENISSPDVPTDAENKPSSAKDAVRVSRSGSQEQAACLQQMLQDTAMAPPSTEDNRPLSSPESGNKESGLVGSPENRSAIVNNPPVEEFDLSILDKDDWEDEIEYQEFSIDQVLDEMALLQSDDEEDEEGEEEEGEIREDQKDKEATDDKRSREPAERGEMKTELAVPVAASPSRKKKISGDELRSIKYKYYEVLKFVYDLYKDEPNIMPIPPLSQAEPRVFYSSANIIGFESLEEFIDNKHPLWCDQQVIFREFMLEKCTTQHLLDDVQRRWLSTYKFDMNRNFSQFPRPRQTRPGTSSFSRGGGPSKGFSAVDAKEKKGKKPGAAEKMKLIAMYEGVQQDAERLRQKERERFAHYKQQLTKLAKKKEEEEEEKGGCNYCFKYCLCSPGRKPVQRPGQRRRHYSSSDEVTAKRAKNTNINKGGVIDTFIATLRSENLQRCGRIAKSIEEVFKLNALYQGLDAGAAEETVKELASLERIHDDFSSYYKSPYSHGNSSDHSAQAQLTAFQPARRNSSPSYDNSPSLVEEY